MKRNEEAKKVQFKHNFADGPEIQIGRLIIPMLVVTSSKLLHLAAHTSGEFVISFAEASANECRSS